MKKVLVIISIIFVFLLGIFIFMNLKKEDEVMNISYISSDSFDAFIYDDEFKEVKKIVRGTKIISSEKEYINEEVSYKKVVIDNEEYFVKSDNIVYKEENIVQEKELYVRTSTIIYKIPDTEKILSSVKKGEKLQVIGYDTLNEDGSVLYYKIKYNDLEGYVYSKYLSDTLESALKNYDEENTYKIHEVRNDRYGGGSAATLDYYPNEKIEFSDNIMPDETRCLYLNMIAINSVDSYIEFAKTANINCFVVDLKDERLSYKSDIAQTYSKTSYDNAYNDLESFTNNVKKLKDNGFYIIGRITTFKDNYYAIDNPEVSIKDNRTGNGYRASSSYWPSAYKREVWEYNVSLALEAVKLFSFNEIQFDYVRFPDNTYSLERLGYIDFQNEYNETKAEAIQQFIQYAADNLHRVNTYISVDVFGETSNDYVTAYGQYWPAISNIVDVISAMPYPDHFNSHDYGIEEVVWTVPYKLLKTWGSYAKQRQSEIPTPARVRTWIQTYNTIKEPYIVYDSNKISEQIRGLYENGLDDGYITWSSSSNLSKYQSLISAFLTNFKK